MAQIVATSGLTPAAAPTGVGPTNNRVAGTGVDSFQKLIAEQLQGVSQQQVDADSAVARLAAGKEDNMHGVVLSVAKADLAFRMMLEIRNRLIDSYQEIMRMQV